MVVPRQFIIYFDFIVDKERSFFYISHMLIANEFLF